jgi:hypothetical protein
LKAYITVPKKAIPSGRLNYPELLKSLSNEFKDSENALVFSPLPGNLIDVVNHLTENQISFKLIFSNEESDAF